MKRIYIYCEGQTEESFVNTVLAPYFFSFDTYLIPIICTTSRKQGQKHRGGAVNYEKIHSELTRLCRSHPSEHVTTMFDYYGMPKNTPETAPSKRILSAMPNYGKVRHGTILAQRIGINKMMEECPHFRNWIEEMKAYV